MKNNIAFILAIGIFCTSFYACKKGDDGPADEGVVEVVNLQKRSEKRGVSYGFQLMEDVELLAPGTSWYYNWANDPSAQLDAATTAQGMKFYPMTWNGSFGVATFRARQI